MAKKLNISLRTDIRFWRLFTIDTSGTIIRVEYLCSNGSWLKLRYAKKRRHEVELYPSIAGIKKISDADKETPKKMKHEKERRKNKTRRENTNDLNNISRPHKCFQRDALDRFGNIIGVEYRCADGSYMHFALPATEKRKKQ